MKPFLYSALIALTLLATPAMAQEAKVGEPAPDFTATDTMGHEQKLSSYLGKTVVLEWHNPECPYVKKHYGSKNMQDTQKLAAENGAVWLRINSAAPGKQGSMSDDQANRMTREQDVTTAGYIRDESGAIGKLYGAKTTPHMFVVDATGTLVYSGAIDDKGTSDIADIATAKNYIKTILEDIKAGRPVSVDNTKPYGCGVKYAE